MSNDYVASILVSQRHSELQYEASQDRLAREARQGQPRRRWWERLMLFRSRPETGRRDLSRDARGVATVAASNSPC